MDNLPISISASSHEAGWTPTAILAVVEYVDPDGNMQYSIITSDGCNDTRYNKLMKKVKELEDK